MPDPDKYKEIRMKPNEHIKLPEDELIAHIRESLMAHEEEYDPGAWEGFIKEEPKKRGLIFWLAGLSSAAAVLLIGFGLFFALHKKELPKNEEITKTKTLEKESALPQVADIISAVPSGQKQGTPISVRKNKSTSGADDIIKAGQGAINLNTNEPHSAIVQMGANQSGVTPGSKSEQVIPQEQVVVPVPAVEKKQSFEDFLIDETKQNRIANTGKPTTKRESKWEMGLVVAPSFGNSKKLNMGYGVSMGYALSDKVSISSGISYNEMGASRTIENPPNMAMMSMSFGGGVANDSKELKAVNAQLRGIDIPLELKYHLSKRLYANVGVSAFAVIDQKQQNTFIESKVAPQAYDGAGGNAKAMVLNKTVSEEAPKEEIKNDPYLGFYNFSVGYRQKISKGKAFSVEPFIKLPMKELKQENLYLIGTGVKLKFDF
jgi:cytoskeletal protein RodZ